jgi:AcrR family transcriptional regulator
MSNRLTKEKWVQHGLETLEKSGFGALNAEPLAKALKVSRGSFYWHFNDIDVFRKAVLELWRQHTTLEVIEVIEELSSKPERLKALMQRAFNSRRDLERAVRAWSIKSPDAARVVATVDIERVDYLSKLLAADGVSNAHLMRKATFLYWAYLGQTMMMNNGSDHFGDAEIEELLASIRR